jgi:hypothetical protein
MLVLLVLKDVSLGGSGAGSSDNVGHIPVWVGDGRCSRVVARGLGIRALDGVSTLVVFHNTDTPYIFCL